MVAALGRQQLHYARLAKGALEDEPVQLAGSLLRALWWQHDG
jgi:hypothetical protein